MTGREVVVVAVFAAGYLIARTFGREVAKVAKALDDLAAAVELNRQEIMNGRAYVEHRLKHGGYAEGWLDATTGAGRQPFDEEATMEIPPVWELRVMIWHVREMALAMATLNSTMGMSTSVFTRRCCRTVQQRTESRKSGHRSYACSIVRCGRGPDRPARRAIRRESAVADHPPMGVHPRSPGHPHTRRHRVRADAPALVRPGARDDAGTTPRRRRWPPWRR